MNILRRDRYLVGDATEKVEGRMQHTYSSSTDQLGVYYYGRLHCIKMWMYIAYIPYIGLLHKVDDDTLNGYIPGCRDMVICG